MREADFNVSSIKTANVSKSFLAEQKAAMHLGLQFCIYELFIIFYLFNMVHFIVISCSIYIL